MPTGFMIVVGGRPALSRAPVVSMNPLTSGSPLRAEVLQAVEVFFPPGVLRRAVLAGDDQQVQFSRLDHRVVP
jgi:hypothetical protein